MQAEGHTVIAEVDVFVIDITRLLPIALHSSHVLKKAGSSASDDLQFAVAKRAQCYMVEQPTPHRACDCPSAGSTACR
jgi:hypothetical protein